MEEVGSQEQISKQPETVFEQPETEIESSAAEPVQVPADAILHIVEDGETLYGICLKYYHNVNNLSQILEWNKLSDENHLSVGRELFLPPT